MALSNLDKSNRADDADANTYVIDPALLDIIKGFFESKGFDVNTSAILARNMIVGAIDDGAVTQQDLLSILQKGGDIYDVKSANIWKAGSGYRAGDMLKFKYPGIDEEISVKVSAVDSNGAIVSIELDSSGIVQSKPRNPISPSSTTGTGKGAFFNMIYQNTLKPNAELSKLASYLINTTRYPSSFTGVMEDPEENKVFKRLIV